MNKTVKIIIGCFLALGAIACGVKVATILYQPKPTLTSTMATTTPTTTSETTKITDPDPSKAVTPTYTSVTTEETTEVYVSPVDFEALQDVNEDIYAWIYIEGTDIDYPVVQSPTNDEFYLDHNSDGDYSSAGAVFSEHEFNGTDFSDPVTVLYGHHMSNGDIFGNLQVQFMEDEFWQSEPVITIYLPDRELRYQVFAAVPYGHFHILYYHDFTDEEVYEDFFDEIMATHAFEANTHEEYAPVYGDKVIVLSTCLIGNNYNRYTVMGKLVYDSSEVS